MQPHLDAWKAEYGKARWLGPYDIAPIVAAVRPGALMLDAGCGSGRLAVPLARASYRVVGLDLVRESLLETRGRGAVAPVEGDVRQMPFRDGAFDAVVCYDVLQHLLGPERARAAEEIWRVLAPGGTAFIAAFGREDMRYGGDEVEPHTFRRESGIVYHYFSEEELRGLLSRFGRVRVENAVTHRTFRGGEHTRHRLFASGLKEP
ncbi:MAG TPA: class I SAM-dependent methyltransferase [Methanocella sp.]|nr:class I SAM-dependent methyltransferase [Methanocella sp.]